MAGKTKWPNIRHRCASPALPTLRALVVRCGGCAVEAGICDTGGGDDTAADVAWMATGVTSVLIGLLCVTAADVVWMAAGVTLAIDMTVDLTAMYLACIMLGGDNDG